MIAAVVAHALEAHDFTGPSRLYSRDASGNMRSEANDFGGGGAGKKEWTVVRGGGGGGGGGGGLIAPAAMGSALSAQREHVVEPLPHAVAQLTAMGFPEDKVRTALAASGNLPQQALEKLNLGN